MKKKYINPTTNLFKVQLILMNTTSQVAVGEEYGESGEPGEPEVVLSRRHNNVWDEDEEEEYNEYNY